MLVAIDPGVSGGIAVKTGDVAVYPMPEGMPAIVDFLGKLKRDSVICDDPMECYMEKVGQHVKGNNAQASCTFARHCGNIEATLYCLGIPTTQVMPKVWMKCLGQLPAEKPARKRFIQDCMKTRYPGLKITLKTSDALGILTYAALQKPDLKLGI